MNAFYVRESLAVAREAAGRRAGRCDRVGPTWIGRRFVASLDPPVRRRFTVPSTAMAPDSSLDPAEAVRAFEASHAGYRELLDLCAHCDPNRLRVPNPFFRVVPMRVATILHVIPAHNRRHLWQARNVRAERAGPA
jgi:hypothetical protein